MSRPFRRFSAALLALWFTVFTVEPARVHSCPTHGGAGATAGLDAPSQHAMHHAGHASSAASSVESETASRGSTPDRHGSHHCTCPDAGCCSASLLLAPFATAVAPTADVVSVAVFPTQDAPAVERADYVLPFATAPPTSRLV